MCATGGTRNSMLSTKIDFRDVANVAAGMVVLDFEYQLLMEKAGGSTRVWEKVTEYWVTKMIELLKGRVEVCVRVDRVYRE